MKTTYFKRCLMMFPAVPVCAIGIVLFLRANWGMDPLSNFEYGLSLVFPISMGTASVLFEGTIFFIFFFVNRKLINFGSAAFCFGIGPCINIINALLPVTGEPSFVMSIGMILVGTLIIGVSIAYYIPMNLGLQSLDLLCVTLAKSIGKSYGTGLTIVQVVLFVLSVLLGAPWGVGTLVSAFAFGPMINGMLHWTTPLALRLGYPAAE